mgnify:CR=1 FL=1
MGGCLCLSSLWSILLTEPRVLWQGTCAGLIVLADCAKHMKDGGQPLLGGLKVLVDRNHFGSQLQVCCCGLVWPHFFLGYPLPLKID